MWIEARLPLLAALMAGFGSVISEVGASMMVGGNIRHQTRVLTTRSSWKQAKATVQLCHNHPLVHIKVIRRLETPRIGRLIKKLDSVPNCSEFGLSLPDILHKCKSNRVSNFSISFKN
jgi:hypothetical protein